MPFVDESKVTEWTNRLKSYFALLTHKHDASDITSGTLGVARGGTGGTTALDARKNLSVPVDSSIAYVESTTATKNHAVGDYFMLGSVLMKATSAIATGETINASKATPVTVQAQIDTLRDSVGSLVKVISYSQPRSQYATQEYTFTHTLPSGYKLLSERLYSNHASGNVQCYITDNYVSVSGSTVSARMFVYNPTSSNISVIYSIAYIRDI